MSQEPSPASPPSTEHELHRRSWELELLISGAIVVALLQIPGAIDGAWQQFEGQVSRDLWMLAWYVYFPVKMMLSPTIAIFGIHILLRGFWVGLVGLNAVFPQGPDLDRLDLGPVQRQFYAAKMDTRRLEETVDRIASSMFSLLFSLLSLFTALAIWVFSAMALVLLIRSTGTEIPLETLALLGYLGAFTVLIGPGLFVGVLDRILLSRKVSTGRMARIAYRALSIYWILSLAFLWYPAQATLLSNLSRRKISWWRMILVTLPIGLALPLFVLLPLLGPRLLDDLDSWTWRPDVPAESGTSSLQYEDERGLEPPEGPTISTATPSGDWLRVFLPYSAGRDNPRLADICPEARPFRRDGDIFAAMADRSSGSRANRAEALKCFGRLWTLTLDGVQIPSPELLFSDIPVAFENSGLARHQNTRPIRRQPGVLMMLSLHDLPSGRHDLVLERRPSEAEKEGRKFRADAHVFHIPFWH